MCAAFAICPCCNVEANHICFVWSSLCTVPELYVLFVRTKNLSADHIQPQVLATCHQVCAGLNCTQNTLLVFFPTKILYYLKMIIVFTQKQKKTMFKTSFLQATIRDTAQDTVWLHSSSYISVKYRLGSELTVHLSSGCCVLSWQNCQASSFVLKSEKLVSLILTSFCLKHWLSFRGL